MVGVVGAAGAGNGGGRFDVLTVGRDHKVAVFFVDLRCLCGVFPGKEVWKRLFFDVVNGVDTEPLGLWRREPRPQQPDVPDDPADGAVRVVAAPVVVVVGGGVRIAV